MITFQCPSCCEELELPPSRAGTRGPCPRCGKPISVPRGTPRKSGLDYNATALLREENEQTQPAIPPPVPQRVAAFEFQDDEPEPTVRRRRRSRTPWVGIGVVGGLVVVGLLVALWVKVWSVPKEAKEKSDARELLKQAKFHYEDGSKTKAMELVTESIRLGATAEAYLLRSDLYSLQELYYKAADDVVKAVKLGGGKDDARQRIKQLEKSQRLAHRTALIKMMRESPIPEIRTAPLPPEKDDDIDRFPTID